MARLLTVLVSAGIIACFFEPWIRIHSLQLGFLKQVVGGSNSAGLLTFSGFSIPQAANGALSRTVLGILGTIFWSVRDADMKSYLVWLVPLIAGLMGVGVFRYPRSRMWCLFCGVLGLGVFGNGVYRVMQLDSQGFVFRVEICWAFWATLCGYLALGMLYFQRLKRLLGRS